MSKLTLDLAVAKATGESVDFITNFGFQWANPPYVEFDPEPRGPSVYDWDNASAPNGLRMHMCSATLSDKTEMTVHS